ncbi:hypothetical protein RND71_032644 [Anisodus tanguticus]|uniref:PDZ domain-containing protein n=1 Tax=Anisodus tanguticus TaxID=243964 RepID=A0AAE1R715_9SOLA|nr:hypothetical protein RND71_032644 [Anisodus tanguticus]
MGESRLDSLVAIGEKSIPQLLAVQSRMLFRQTQRSIPGVGFSIPVDTVSGIVDQLGLLPTKRDSYGRLILGDIITSINGKKVSNGTDLYRILDQCKVGEKVIVEVLRGDQKEKIPVLLEPKPEET